MTYITYSNICANLVRQCLKEPYKSEAITREKVHFSVSKWTEGKPQKPGEFFFLSFLDFLSIVMNFIASFCSDYKIVLHYDFELLIIFAFIVFVLLIKYFLLLPFFDEFASYSFVIRKQFTNRTFCVLCHVHTTRAHSSSHFCTRFWHVVIHIAAHLKCHRRIDSCYNAM